MTDLIVIQPQVTELTVTEDVNQVVVSSVGVQGPKGDTGATGATGATGPSGVVSVTAPITNSGTSTSANIGVSAGSTTAAGVLQLTDSVSSTSTTTAATPNAVKTAYDLALLQPIMKQPSGTYRRTPYAGNANFPMSQNVTYYTPIFISTSTTYDRLSCRTGTFSTASTVRLGIYNDTNGAPGTLLLDAGTVSATSATTDFLITINQTLAAGFYWLAFNSISNTTTAFLGAASAGVNVFNQHLLYQASPASSGATGYSQSINASAGFPSSASSLTVATTVAYTFIRAA